MRVFYKAGNGSEQFCNEGDCLGAGDLCRSTQGIVLIARQYAVFHHAGEAAVVGDFHITVHAVEGQATFSLTSQM